MGMTEPWYQNGLRFRCTRCGHCCTGDPGNVWVNDREIAAIAEHRGELVQQVTALYTRLTGRRRSLRGKAQRRLYFLRPQGRLHHLPGKAPSVPDLALLGAQCPHSGSLAADLPGVP